MLSAKVVFSTLLAGVAVIAAPMVSAQASQPAESSIGEAIIEVPESPQGEPEVPMAPETAPVGWSALSDNGRYLSIMGTLDAFAAAGVNPLPCFPAGDMGSIDTYIKSKGFGAADPMQLPGILNQISDCSSKNGSSAASPPASAYTVGLFKDMRDEDIAYYVSAAVNAYQGQGLCNGKNDSGLAKRLAKGLRSGSPEARVPPVMKDLFDEACKS